MFLHEASDAQHRRAVLEHQEPGVHAEVGEVDLELALRLDGAARCSQAHVGARPHAIADVARQRVVGAEVVSRPPVSAIQMTCAPSLQGKAGAAKSSSSASDASDQPPTALEVV